MARSRLLALPALAAAAALLAACGSTEAPATGGSDGATSDADAALTVTDDRGTEVSLDGPATKVVSLEWNLTEDLLALGVAPVGAADVEGYNTWDTAVALDAKTPDVGTRGEPSIDAIVATEPDLVVTTADLPETVIAQIEATDIPVLVVKGADAKDPLGQMRHTVELLGEATGTSDKATALLADYDAKIEEGTKALEAAGKAGGTFIMADGWVASGTVSVRVFTDGAMLSAITGELGLTNAWTGTGGDPAYGLETTDVEGLTGIAGSPEFFYITNDGDGGSEFAAALEVNAIWQGLEFVKAGQVHRLADGIWMFGGPLAAGQYIDAVVAAMTK